MMEKGETEKEVKGTFITLGLTGEEENRFKNLKEHLGLKTNASVIHFALKRTADELLITG